MPNRILRDGINDSEAINALSFRGELLYRRLMSVADDFGRYDAIPALILGKCFSLQLDRWTIEDIATALAECVELGIIRLYEVGAKRYLQIEKFGQRIRPDSKSRYPEPPETVSAEIRGGNPRDAADRGGNPPSRARAQSESESYAETETQSGAYALLLSESERANVREMPPRKPTAPAPLDRQVIARELIDDLASRHPKPGNIAYAYAAAEGVLATAQNPRLEADRIRENHVPWCEYWRIHNPKFIPQLHKWLNESDWRHPPSGDAMAATGTGPLPAGEAMLRRLMKGIAE